MTRILLVEDNAINQLIATKTLRGWHMEVVIANHGLEAIALIKDKSFQLILMDLNMPVMDGFESTRRIREMDDLYFKTIPIIAFTASGIADAKEKALQSGMTDLMAKPLQPRELQSVIDQYVGKHEK